MKSLKKKPNILILCTDQQRTIQHFPKGWAKEHLPWTTHLKETGVTFKNNMCSSTACSPSRSTIFSGTYPTINGVLKVNDTMNMSRTLPMGGSLITLGQIMSSNGYQMIYKGKWHLDESFAAFSDMHPSDLDRMMIEDDAMENHYSFPGWTSPDLGTGELIGVTPAEKGPNSSLNSIGGGEINNDARIVNGPMYDPERQQCAVDFIKQYNPHSEKPFCLVVSLANPHDIWLYPTSFEEAGYTDKAWLSDAYEGFFVPKSYDETLDNKPTAQTDFLNLFQGGKLTEKHNQDLPLEYVKFYAYLQTLIDSLTGDLIQALHHNVHVGEQLREDTVVIRMSDHGEMGLAHGGLRQKENNCYRETINVPMIFSNPNLPQNVEKEDFVSLIDLMPTIADLTDSSIPKGRIVQGQSYCDAVVGDTKNPKKFNYFATDDGALTYTSIRAIIDENHKYAVYYAAKYNGSFGTTTVNYNGVVDLNTEIQYELYDYSRPEGREETENLLSNGVDSLDDHTAKVWNRLHSLLTEQMKTTFTLPDKWEQATQSESGQS